MKQLGITCLMVALLCGGLVFTASANDQKLLGKSKQKTVKFVEDVLVNDQVVKKGDYRVKFDAPTSTVTIIDDNGVTVATAKASVKMRDQKAPYNSIASSQTDRGKVMTSLTFAGDKRLIMLEEPANSTAEAQAQR